MSTSTARPVLEGFRIVEISAFVAAPIGGATLAAMGADVVRIDPIGGGIDAHRWPVHNDRSLYWAGLNQGKRSVTINAKTEAGRRLVRDLVCHAGMCLTNLPLPDWMSYERLAAVRPDIILAVITGNPDGSVAVDYTINAAIGFPWITGPVESAGPVNHVLPAWDTLTGYLVAAGLIAAELRRVRTGHGDHLTISLADVALSVSGHLGYLAEAQLVSEPRRRYGNDLYGSFARDFATADGRRVIVVALTARQWNSLVSATELREHLAELEKRLRMDFQKEGDRFGARREICELLEPWFAKRTLDELRPLLDPHGVLWGPYQTFQELLVSDERASLRNPLVGPITQPGLGGLLATGSPLVFAGAERLPPRPAPTMGEHTVDVLASWLDLTAPEIADLRAQGAIDS
ncbi:MAG: CoA transferase [Chloroflexota bacterium]